MPMSRNVVKSTLVRLGQSHVDGAVVSKGAPAGDEHTVAAGRWDKRRCVSIAERTQGFAKPWCRRAPAIFGKNHDIGVVTLERVGDPGQPRSAALPDVPGEQPHSPTLLVRIAHCDLRARVCAAIPPDSSKSGRQLMIVIARPRRSNADRSYCSSSAGGELA